MSMIPLMRPYLPRRARELLDEVLASGHLTEGAMTRRLEALVAQYVGAPHALAVANCSLGLEAALRVAGVCAGDEIVIPDFTYPATADAVILAGATAVVVDVDQHSMLTTPEIVEPAISARTKALLPVSLFGNPLDQRGFRALADNRGLVVIEDAACALGSAVGSCRTGAWADITAFSFHPRKFVTTGEGGMLTTVREDFAERIHAFAHFGMTKAADRNAAVFSSVGTNLKLSNLNAAIGVAQMEVVDELLRQRRAQAQRYDELLASRPGIELPQTTLNGTHSYQTYGVFLENRDRVLASLRARGIEAQIGTYCLSRQPAFQGHPQVRFEGTFSGSHRAGSQMLALPLFHELTEAQQERVVRELRAAL